MISPYNSQAAIDAAAAKWVARRTAGLSAGEKDRLQEWLAADPRHAESWERFDRSWSALDRPRETGSVGGFKLALVAARRRRRQKRAQLGMLAVLVLGMAGVGWWKRAPLGDATAVAEASTPTVVGPERRTLPDGTLMEFPAGTRYAIAYSPAERRIVLEQGGGNFHVVPDVSRPFVVVARGVAVRAVGTVFAVHMRNAEVAVLVTEGRVEVAGPAAAGADPVTPAPVYVDAGQRASVATAAPVDSPVKVRIASAEEINAELAWRSPQVEFSRTPLIEVVSVLNRHNRVQLAVADPAIMNFPVSGRFRADDAEAFVSVLRAGFGIVVDEAGPDRRVLRQAP